MPQDLTDFIAGDLPGWAGYVARACRSAGARMFPQVIFGSPFQAATDAGETWWHIPVTLKRQLLSGKKIEDARVYARVTEPSLSERSIEMIWRDKDRTAIASAKTLRVGEVAFIPVVWRREHGDRQAYISDQEFVRSDRKQKAVALPAKDAQMKLQCVVRHGTHTQASVWYIIRNPDLETNAHFSLEMPYEGLGTGAFLHDKI